jgi:hypothetical protein
MKRVGIKVVDHTLAGSTSSRFNIPDDLPYIKEALKV